MQAGVRPVRSTSSGQLARARSLWLQSCVSAWEINLLVQNNADPHYAKVVVKLQQTHFALLSKP